MDTLISNTQISEDDYILDAGCGVGNLTFEIASIVKKGYVIGIDSSDSMMQQCNETVRDHGMNNIEFLTLNLTDIVYENQFNIIFSNSVLHWVKEIKKALKAFSKALKPGGCIALQFPLLNTSHPLVYFANKVIDKLNLCEFYTNWEFPWYTPTVEEFQTLLCSMDWCNIKTTKIQTNFKFNSVQDAYEFFDSIGLQLFLNIL